MSQLCLQEFLKTFRKLYNTLMSRSRAQNSIKRISNPVTGTYYQIRVRSTSAGNKGTIIGKWSPPRSAQRKSK